MINCSKFIIDGLQQPYDFDSFLFIIEKLIVRCISAKKNYDNLTKNNHKFQASATERYTSLSKSSGMFRQNPLKVPVKKLNTFELLLCKWFLRFLVNFFSTIHRNLFVSHMADIFCIRITHNCKKYFFPLLLLMKWKTKEK